ncbi:MAG: hypothetical protein HY866_19410 [Chloroflexi bacterium]|nr:hypothetical protein [Chloroflexota bacterium]
MGKNKNSQKDTFDTVSTGIFLIGIGVFIWLNLDWWPWFLLVVGLASLPSSLARDGIWAGLQGMIWLGGLSILFATGTFWPGILILAGLSTIAGAIARPPIFEKEKPKRGLPLSDQDEDDAAQADEWAAVEDDRADFSTTGRKARDSYSRPPQP